jgi:hypothetical protein
MRVVILILIAACSGGSHDTFTVGDAVRAFAPAACTRLQRCGPFPYVDLAACFADVVQRECAAHDCNAPYPGTAAELEQCSAAFEQQPCVTTEPLPTCLRGTP